MARIRLRIHVTGTFHGIEGGVLPGTIVEVDDVDSDRYVKNCVAEYVTGDEENAVVEPTQVESAVVKRRKTRKPADWHDEKAPGWSKVDKES
jgi:hypothetical protein